VNVYHSGWVIDQLTGLVKTSLPSYRPNVVTLHIGTNDMNNNVAVIGAPVRLAGLIDQILAAAPDATVLVATLVPASNPDTEARIAEFNQDIPGVVDKRRSAGKHVRLVDMSAVTTADLADGLHPNDSGYRKMADAFHRGIQDAVHDGARDAGGDVGDGGALGPLELGELTARPVQLEADDLLGMPLKRAAPHLAAGAARGDGTRFGIGPVSVNPQNITAMPISSPR